MPKSRRRNRKGFTLTEVLLVMAILVMIGGLATVAIFQAQNNATRNATISEINALKQACTRFRLQTNHFPNKLDDLVILPAGMTQAKWGGPHLDRRPGPILDPWGNPYRYERNEQTFQVNIWSTGPDGVPSDDDVPTPSGK
ncbi:MAG TPA: type II secretion system protein GspG [Pirellulaceae bacterium]|nr:type II secretion system protein GspG [Pirellulaceae bacterium]HMO92693.1 type II secretion system protein GspG [Pirellulaceae bacterium]HMP70386.1 type II secretion system protein GspG [Pirellulaceae bacterium]